MVSLVAPTYSLKGKPHWRRTQQVYALLNQAPPEATYDRLIDYVREKTGKGCSRKLISKWKKLTIHNSANRIQNNGNEQSSNRAVFPEPKSDSPQNPTEKAEPKAKNSHPIQEKVLQVARSTWSYVAATAIVVGLAGCGWFLSKDNSQTAIAQPTSIQNSEFKTQNE